MIMINLDVKRSAGVRALKCAALATVATSALASPMFVGKAQAQALQPVVDVCTGITLPRSAVTEVIGAVNQPIVEQIETTVNDITTVTLVLSPLATITDLNIDLSTILADAEAGEPISLQILDTDGNVITASDDCNVVADAYTLDGQSGIEIGGNQITGLGADGQTASAGELDAIAFGNNASTAAGATGAVAIGTNASATAANSVALGADSVADRADTVSVGSAGNERQIVNVADGTTATDAATVGQVDAAIALATQNIVEYDDATQSQVTLQGAGGTTVTNVAAGIISGTSTDAVNGSQLFATNQSVDANATDIASLDGRVTVNEGDIAALDGRVTVNEGDIASLDGRLTTAEGDIVGLDTRVTANEDAITTLEELAVQYDDATQTSITLGGAGGTVVTNVAPGDVSAASTDAVNGAQLFATNQAVDALDARVTVNEADIATNTANIATNTTAIANLQVTANAFDGRITQNEQDIADLDGRVTVNEGDIADLDGRVTVNEGDIAALDGRVTVNEGDIADLDGRVTVNEGDIANLDGRVTVNEGDIASLDGRVTVNEGDITSLDGRVTVNEGDITSLDNRVTTNEGDIVSIDGRVTANETNITNIQVQLDNVPVTYVSDADGSTPSAVPTDTAAFVGASGGTVRVTNVAEGELAAGSTDAVNGSQLYATNQAVAQNTADIATINSNLAGSTVVAVQYSDPDNPTVSNGGTVTNDVTLVGADPAAPVALHNVANGTLANDAANIGQLQAGLSNVMASSMSYADQRMADAMAYTDMRIADLSFDLSDFRDEAFSGTAAAMAMSSIPQSIEPNKSLIGGAVGHYRGKTAFGFGYSGVSGDRKMIFNARGSVDTDGNGGFAVGAGLSF
ncbi:YadA-like family protein [Qipengyuania aquimaris]|uniref:YadA-like family protein n=1 Tax=Qipengyuania aquimaris TaxID=255984 RepID=UPI001FD286FA|nr:YadA-like family protein [Qipengyuania aquimaris]UOR16692.1 YadA-like family protein [Qipengyuania aquimaris]